MKKIDLHIHTVSTVSDREFKFSIETFKRYVDGAGLDAVAITNHNTFDLSQFTQIQEELSCKVFPGIEIDLQSGHLLLISSGNDLDDFHSKCSKVSSLITTATDFITPTKLTEIFGDLNPYLIIPHYKKSPAVSGSEFADLLEHFSVGEVDSAKKFVREMKADNGLCPVLFSDARIEDHLSSLPTRQTYVDCGEISLSAIKACLRDKSKVFLSNNDGNDLFQVFDNGQHISTGLNIIYGERSSGKTVTLNRLSKALGNVKYIRQFDLVQASDEEDSRRFNADVQQRRSGFVEEYLSDFRGLIGDMSSVKLEADEKAFGKYIDTLIRSAEEADRKDSFSKVLLYDEPEFQISKNNGTKDLIRSVINLIENIDHRSIIESHVQIPSLRNLAVDLIKRLWDKADDDKKRTFVNTMVKDVQSRLQLRTSATRIETTDLYSYALNKRKVQRFNAIAKSLQTPMTIFDESVQGFRIVAEKGPFSQSSELNMVIKSQAALKDALKSYDNPYEYLCILKDHDKIHESELHRLFTKITYRILNQDGTEVSGGQRSEFRLLQAIKDAQQYDAMLIDEPESSFDNVFLNRDVNKLIKDIALNMPVVVVTHNNSVGASVNPNYLIYAEKKRENSTNVFRLYSGHPTDKTLKCVDGSEVNTYDVFLNSLEAGPDAYKSRKEIYEAVKD